MELQTRTRDKIVAAAVYEDYIIKLWPTITLLNVDGVEKMSFYQTDEIK